MRPTSSTCPAASRATCSACCPGARSGARSRGRPRSRRDRRRLLGRGDGPRRARLRSPGARRCPGRCAGGTASGSFRRVPSSRTTTRGPSRCRRLIALQAPRGSSVLGIDEETALIGRDGSWQVHGRRRVTVWRRPSPRAVSSRRVPSALTSCLHPARVCEHRKPLLAVTRPGHQLAEEPRWSNAASAGRRKLADGGFGRLPVTGVRPGQCRELRPSVEPTECRRPGRGRQAVPMPSRA